MAKARLSSYIKKIESKYIIAREKYEKACNELDMIESRHRNLDKTLYSRNGLEKEFLEYVDQKENKIKELSVIRDGFLADCTDIVKDSDKVFDRRFGYNPADIDNNGLAILENGNPTPSEIMRLGNLYKEQGNNTMLFMCAERLKDSKDIDVMGWCAMATMDRRTRPDHDNLDGFIEVCKAGLRDDVNLSNGIHKRHDEFLVDAITRGDEITVDVPNPWE